MAALPGGWLASAWAQGKARAAVVAEAQRALGRDDLEGAVKKFREAFAQGPGSVEEYRTVAEVLRSLERHEEALAAVREGLGQHPEDWELRAELGGYLAGADRFEEAYAHYQELDRKLRAARPDLRNDLYFCIYGAAAERTGRLAESVPLFEQAISQAPVEEFPQRAARPYNYLGFVLLELNRDLQRAVELIHHANELDPDCSAYVDSLGWANFKLGQYPEALRELLRAERMMKEEGTLDPVLLDHLAQTYFRLGHRDKALECLGRAIQLAPEEAAYRKRREEFQKAECGKPLPLDFLQKGEGSADKERSRRR